jgi:hypothetical protein
MAHALPLFTGPAVLPVAHRTHGHGGRARVDRVIDTSDFGASLETAESQSRFVVVTSDEALQALLGAPLIQWRVFLHPTQRKLANGDRNGPMRVRTNRITGWPTSSHIRRT